MTQMYGIKTTIIIITMVLGEREGYSPLPHRGESDGQAKELIVGKGTYIV